MNDHFNKCFKIFQDKISKYKKSFSSKIFHKYANHKEAALRANIEIRSELSEKLKTYIETDFSVDMSDFTLNYVEKLVDWIDENTFKIPEIRSKITKNFGSVELNKIFEEKVCHIRNLLVAVPRGKTYRLEKLKSFNEKLTANMQAFIADGTKTSTESRNIEDLNFSKESTDLAQVKNEIDADLDVFMEFMKKILLEKL